VLIKIALEFSTNFKVDQIDSRLSLNKETLLNFTKINISSKDKIGGVTFMLLQHIKRRQLGSKNLFDCKTMRIK